MAAGEIILAVVLLLILFSASVLLRPTIRTPQQVFREFQLWVAQGLGVGRIPLAPGTFGSLVGLVWFVLLVQVSGAFWLLILGILIGLALSVWWCAVGERMLGQTDPGSVVLDEIAAMPVCFLAWVVASAHHSGSFPSAGEFFHGRNWLGTVGVFAAFRLFDVWKPWPVRQSQALPRGWGVTVDDLLAAVYVNLAVIIALAVRALFSR